MKKIGLLTSGGDAPGMNAAIRAIVTACATQNISCIGFERGYNGVIDNNFVSLNEYNVKHICHLGGTIIKTARCHRLMEVEYQQLAADNLTELQLDAMIIIGGDGSFRGALAIQQLVPIPFVGIPATIDNDIDGCDYTIGFQTAVQTATEAIDKIRDTADALERIFVVEVMGRHSGFLALDVGIATEAEQIICPEMNIDAESLIDNLTSHIRSYVNHMGHVSYIIVIAENSYPEQGANGLAAALEQQLETECRAVVLGHLQRGGSAISQDRLLGSKLGYFAINRLLEGETDIMVGELNGKLTSCALSKTVHHKKLLNPHLLTLYKGQCI